MKKKIGILGEFKEFISRGSVIDLAIGVIMGTAFTAIVNSLVNHIVMPFIGWIIGGLEFAHYKLVLSPAVGETPETAILYGAFIQAVVNFILIALVVFIIVKGINSLHRKKEAPPAEPAPDPQIVLLTEIRDLLKDKEA